MSSGCGPSSRIGGLTLLECHQHHVESCVHRYIYILLNFKIAFKSNANAASIDAIWISSFSSKWIQTHCMRFCYLTLVLVEMQPCPLIVPLVEFLYWFFHLFQVNLLCSLSIKLNRVLSIWRGLSPYCWLTAYMEGVLQVRTWNHLFGEQQTLRFAADVINKDHFNCYSSLAPADYCSSPHKSHETSSGHSSHSQAIMQDSEHSSDWPKPGKTAKICTWPQSLKAGSLMIQKLKKKETPNIISNIPACLSHHIVLLARNAEFGVAALL